MISKLVTKVFGSKHDREMKELRPRLEQINAFEPTIEALEDGALAAKTGEFRQRLERGATLEDILPAAFAVVREAGRRTVAMRQYDVQLIGGMVLHEGRIAEMKTGEGKTLVATLPAYLNALAGNGVHVVTVNDYLARRDSEWMARIYRFLGLDVGVIQHDLEDAERRAAYAADVTYGTNNEFGFDYLRDNMKHRTEDMVQRGHSFAIVDEVDSILIDEARTPLIISGPTDSAPEKYTNADRVIPQLRREVHYQVDEKHKTATFTEEGTEKIEKVLALQNLYDPDHMDLVRQLHNSLRAHTLYKRDRDYMVEDGEVVIIDEFTGRKMPGRRWSEGLHQAVEAKERVKIQRESQTYATVTFQNYFRMYEKLSGMTGTAETEAGEFHKIYKLDVTVIPTNRDLIRLENPDIVYRTEREKFSAIGREITRLYLTGQPVLVGTISIEKSERLSEMLAKMRAFYASRPSYLHDVLMTSEIVPADKEKLLGELLDAERCRRIVERPARLKELLSELTVEPDERTTRLQRVLEKGKIPHVVLNAKQHEREGEIVAQAGQLGAVTIATNMAGRGTDILLGGNPEIMAKAELGLEAEIEDVDRFRATVERFREKCEAEHQEVVETGGLFILGSERHEARRIDNQLRGRAGRQGDPGASRFFLSLEDDLMRIFSSDRVSVLMQRLGMEEDEPIEHKMVTRAIERAQKQVESQNFSIRKHLLEYDDVMNKQREAFYKHRREVLTGDGQREYVLDLAADAVEAMLGERAPAEGQAGQWDVDAIRAAMLDQFGIEMAEPKEELESSTREILLELLLGRVRAKYERKETELDEAMPGLMRRWEQDIMLYVADTAWRDHLYSLDHLKEGIGLRSYGQRDPLVEYKRESFQLFEAMWLEIDGDTLRRIFLFRPVLHGDSDPAPRPRPTPRAELSLGAPPPPGSGASKPKTVRTAAKVGRNAPCPCGSGKKYKRCHGAAA